MNPYDKKHLQELRRIQQQIDALYEKAAQEAAALADLIGDLGDEPLDFDALPLVEKRINAITSALSDGVKKVVKGGITSQWALSNAKNDAMLMKVLHSLVTTDTERYAKHNNDARDAFIARTENGLNLSQRVWKYTGQFRNEMEMALDVGIRSGRSADRLSRDIRQYLQHPDALFRRVRDQHGQLHLSRAAEAYHPGRGVYRSSYMNARRLAATETNIAYRTADHLRWQQMDFVVGIEIRLSNNHNCKGVPAGMYFDICDELAGRYPKDFLFTGWHPHCRCYAVAIQKTEEEILADLDRAEEGLPPLESQNAVHDLPDNFKQWLADNGERIEAANERGTLPYFLRENEERVNMVLERAMKEHPTQYTENAKIYKSLKQNTEYTDVAFDKRTGGVKGRHISHIETAEVHAKERKYFSTDGFEGYTGKDLELKCQDILFRNGYSCILQNEKIMGADGNMQTALDTITNGEYMDIRSITGDGENNVRNALNTKNRQLRKFNHTQESEYDKLILYFYQKDMFVESKVREALKTLSADDRFGIRQILCVVGDGTVHIVKN